MIKLFLITAFLSSTSNSYVINYDLTKVISINDTNAYFGYSILLQRGNPSIAIIGAPKKTSNSQNKGSVYRCNLNSLSCTEYTNIYRYSGIHVKDRNGHFFGSVLDGNDLTGSSYFTCSPRFVTSSFEDAYYVKGRCFYIKNSLIDATSTQIQPLENIPEINVYKNMYVYYDSAYAEGGFNILFLKDFNELLIGAPGMSHWNGALISTKLYSSPTFYSLQNWEQYPDSYYGYAVSWGKFIRSSRDIWYVSGGPRSEKLKGGVVFFERNSKRFKSKLIGEELGSYFGSALLVIHKRNGGDDILVGAPMYSGNSFDEGCVYYYKNRNDGSFYSPVRLRGKSTKSRFGTVIADVGDIDLDSYPDCAISAPYDDDGIGAVYLYYGTSTGFSDDKFHKISPANFNTMYPNIKIKGFGLGISRGNDVDGNGHTDVAIGAYLTGQVFYFRTYDLIDIVPNITANIQKLYFNTKKFDLKYCLTYTQRNKKPSNKSSVMQILSLDDRLQNRINFTDIKRISSDQWYCKEYNVILKENHFSKQPLSIVYKYKIFPEEFKEKDFKIPVSYGCKDDICQTNVSVSATYGNIANVVIGQTRELQLNVTVKNSGEPAFQTTLYLILPPEINLINLRECYFERGSYICSIPGLFKGKHDKSFLLDLTNIEPNRTYLPIKLKVKSDGKEVTPEDNIFKKNISVLLQNSPYVESKSEPDNIMISKQKSTLKMKHYFIIGNQGPSPFKMSLVILVPNLEINGTQGLEITSMENVNTGIITECTYSNKTFVNPTTLNVSLSPNNNSVTLSCFDTQLDCIQILCDGGYFPKSNENALVLLKLKITTENLRKFSNDKDAIIIATTAYLNNGTNALLSTTYTKVYGFSSKSKIPLWIYIISSVVGITLLLLIILVLHKCNFFKRTYKERLENEQDSIEDHDNEQEEKMSEEEIWNNS